jgi:NAD(P)-dependent dehydrogenase (short-subunit alcohol dehydrogenase family)
MDVHSQEERRCVMAWTTNDIPNLSGKVAVVTGANGGLGLETVRELARKGAQVVMAARNHEKAEKARAEVTVAVPDASLELIELDLASLASVRAAAAAIVASHPKVDLLVNNAGVMGIPERRTEDGFEMQFGTNHLGHFALTALILPALIGAGAGRVVSVTSTARHFGKPVDPSNPHLEGNYDPWRAYGQSKLANLHFAVELQSRLEAVGARLASLVAHPGFANTDLQATSVAETGGGSTQRFFHNAVERFGMSPLDGALPQLRAGTDPDAKGGQLYAPRWVNWGPPVRRPLVGRSHNQSAMAHLWDVSEKETGISFDVAAAAAEGP